ncbi:MAG: ABC transporter ATP-binding protein/permease [Lachnospiraceae bacterium]|nr:ABC transporter ATP-binding protein/permease [Lachnospiraceae bacterium]
MAEYKESKDNPLHREFGIWSNTKYVLGKAKKYCVSALVLAAIGMVASSILQYFWGVFGKYVLDIIENGTDNEEKWRNLIMFLLVAGGITTVLIISNTISGSLTWYKYINIRMRVISERVNRVLGLNYEVLERPDVLDLHERALEACNDNQNGFEGMLHIIPELGKNLLTVIVTFVAVTVLDVRLIICLVLLAVIQFLYYRKIVKKDKVEVWDMLSPIWRKIGYMSRVTQDFEYAKDIRLFGLSKYLVNKQKKIFREKEERMDKHFNMWSGHAYFADLITLLAKGLVYAVLFYSVLKKDLSIGNFTMFLALSTAFSQSLPGLLIKFGDYKKCSLRVDDLRTFMELDIIKKEETIPLPKADAYTIEFKDVSYKYLKADNYALRHLNLKINAGERLAVVGLNGAGKTTMIKLLLRLYDPTEGVITLNGVDIKKYDREEYYRLFAPVFQDVETFAFPIAENVSMKTAADTDKDKVAKVLEEAGLAEKIASLKHGIDTYITNIVEDDGIDLSGGEKQKLALARALYKGASVVVLDEPTSALDAIAEQQLYERFDKMIGKKSAVYISHRLASTRFCDNIAMFKEGEMIEYGSFDELMDKNGEYANMFNIQAKYYNEEATPGPSSEVSISPVLES